MNDIRTPGGPGQNLESSRILHSRPAPLNEPERAQIVTEVLDALQRTAELARKLGPSPVPDDPPVTVLRSPFAVRVDGVFLMNVEHLEGVDLAGRPVWVGVELQPDEAAALGERMQNAAYETAAHLAGRMPRALRSANDTREQAATTQTDKTPEEDNPLQNR